MFIQILQKTPTWVWAVLATLIVLGLSQTRTRQLSPMRATLVPLVFIGLALTGVINAFVSGWSTLCEWAVGVLIAVTCLGRLVVVRGAEWSERARNLTVPGSFVPLALILGVFLLRYAVGIELSLHPERALDTTFAGACALAYGASAGLFWARAQSLRYLARSKTVSIERSVRQ